MDAHYAYRIRVTTLKYHLHDCSSCAKSRLSLFCFIQAHFWHAVMLPRTVFCPLQPAPVDPAPHRSHSFTTQPYIIVHNVSSLQAWQLQGHRGRTAMQMIFQFDDKTLHFKQLRLHCPVFSHRSYCYDYHPRRLALLDSWRFTTLEQ